MKRPVLVLVVAMLMLATCSMWEDDEAAVEPVAEPTTTTVIEALQPVDAIAIEPPPATVASTTSTTAATTTTRKPTTTLKVVRTVRTTVKQAPAPTGDSVWDRLAMCESGNTNNGGAPYYGFWQFDAQTWRSVGETGLPNQYSREHQLAAAKRLQARRGWSPWPACSRKLGLR